MMKIVYNQDGSIKEKEINEIITQGNNNVNKIAISIKGLSSDDFAVYAGFTLPNGVIHAPVIVETVVDNEYIISLSETETILEGVLKLNIIVTKNNKTLVTTTINLYVNDGVQPGDPVIITREQYENLITRRDIVDVNSLYFRQSKIPFFSSIEDIPLTTSGIQEKFGFTPSSTGTYSVILSMKYEDKNDLRYHYLSLYSYTFIAPSTITIQKICDLKERGLYSLYAGGSTTTGLYISFFNTVTTDVEDEYKVFTNPFDRVSYKRMFEHNLYITDGTINPFFRIFVKIINFDINTITPSAFIDLTTPSSPQTCSGYFVDTNNVVHNVYAFSCRATSPALTLHSHELNQGVSRQSISIDDIVKEI